MNFPTIISLKMENQGLLQRIFSKYRKPITIGAILATPLVAQGGLWVAEAISYLTSPRINSKQEMVQVVREEAPKLGLEPDNIECRFLPGHALPTGHTSPITGRHYLVESKELANREITRHELYHFKKDHHNPYNETSWLGRQFREFGARTYALLGIEL